ncbi:Haloacid dehalogenase, type II [Rhodococcus sp. AW25M09]|uniref:haloacid dehalogenase type II n=1 Tax=Rhodococcus sp. AW25M09 TaxID=1268303 RepID=UPI0002AC67E5|nr:haloacid dehalogenase type II [Rhodococcus sp. AW25M09]CCQ17934.1 Haloacid dehalogenase, type II [Rhodococcus sp. AW25M09]
MNVDATGPEQNQLGGSAQRRPRLIVFDVNETLSDMTPMADRFVDVGASPDMSSLWFANLLRDGFALAAAGAASSFAEIGSGLLRVMLSGTDLDRSVDDAVEHIMSGFVGLEPHPDVAQGVEALTSLGIRVVTLSNGSTRVAESLLESAGVRKNFETLLSVDAAGAWKPAARAYRYTLDTCGVDPADAMLVAVHPWDIDGAHRAGLATAWINRNGAVYPPYFRAPDVEATSLVQLASRLT